MMASSIDKHLFIIMGGTGNLSLLKLLPALYQLFIDKNLRGYCHILGVGTKDIGDVGFKKKASQALLSSGYASSQVDLWCKTSLSYQTLGSSADNYPQLLERIKALERDKNLPGNRIFYLALPPSLFPKTIKAIGESELSQSSGWVRLVVEKPFGQDLASARELNQLLHVYFEEPQVYRIDHYLGKETIQNLLIFRFANTIFESLWSREKIESVAITVAESIGIGQRARYYEQAGALRDMVQNHLAQLLSLIAMEVPALFKAEAIRDEKVKVLHSIQPLQANDVIFGQYEKGEIEGQLVNAYREEPGVNPNSSTETYVALRLKIDNWRWQGIPFYLRTGKRLRRRLTQITVNFRRPPICLFKPYTSCQIHSNKLLITIQPNEGFHLFFDVKQPQEPLRLKTESFHFHYKDVFGPLPEAYQTLIFDIMTGDQTLFVRADEVEASWQIFEPLLHNKIPVYSYPAGTWGPKEADRFFKPAQEIMIKESL